MKQAKKYHIIGLMSGTSCDGLDVAYCTFWQQDNNWQFELLESGHYVNNLWDKLSSVYTLSTHQLAKLDVELGQTIGQFVNQFLTDKNIAPSTIDFVASHGHTVLHAPQDGYTLQIGNGNAIKATTGLTTIFDFRSMDVALGGQGAPLVPVGDELLFSDYDYCLNIGGIANVSYNKNGERKAQDICYAGIALNRLATQLGIPYDDKGEIARTHTPNSTILAELLQLDFAQQSLGIEQYLETIVPILSLEKSIETNLATVTHYTATKIAELLSQKASVLVTGGGAFNDYLIELIKIKSGANIIIPSKDLIEYKEAILFGFLGVLKMENISNCLASVTGAKHDSVGGVIV